MGEMLTKSRLENLKGREQSVDLGIDGKIILERISVGMCGLD
jgi:hypothetical protein